MIHTALTTLSTTKHVPNEHAPFWKWRFLELHLHGDPRGGLFNWRNNKHPIRIEFPAGGEIETDSRKQKVPMVMLSLDKRQAILVHGLLTSVLKMWAQREGKTCEIVPIGPDVSKNWRRNVSES